MAERLLEVKGLKTYFFTDEGVVRAVDGIDLHINKGETLGIVGESGSGKSVTALSIMRLIPTPPGRIVEGTINYSGKNLSGRPNPQKRKIRGKEISMIFQEPMTSLNPVFTVGEQIAEAVRLHEGLGRRDAMAKTVDMLKLVHIPNAERRVKEYPHQLSGGMRQRVMIAMALSCNPKLLIADEPTTALDVTIQAQILELLNELKAKLGMAILLITHDMGVIAETAQRVIVMYGAQVVEEAPVGELFKEPLHPYTQGLLRSIPRIDLAATQKQKLEAAADRADLGRGDLPGQERDDARQAVATRAPEGDADHLPGPVRVAQSADDRRLDHRRGARHPQACADAQGARGARRAAPRDGRPLARSPAPISARVLRRSASAHRDRARAGGEPEAHRRRRAGLRSRRLDPGADREPARGSPGEVRSHVPVHRP